MEDVVVEVANEESGIEDVVVEDLGVSVSGDD